MKESVSHPDGMAQDSGQNMSLPEFIAKTLLLDLETTRGGRIRQVGAVLGGRTFERVERAGTREALEALDAFAGEADAVLGHNLLGHDLPVLKAASPWLALLEKPVIDTLYLSPLAFPQNPYHRLVKDYKLVRASINRPVQDARLAASLFADQWKRFEAMSTQSPARVAFYRFCFSGSRFNGFCGEGIAAVFGRITRESVRNAGEAVDIFLELTRGAVCSPAAANILPGVLSSSARRPLAAYCLAWLQVAGGNSVLPLWVRHRFPEISAVIRALREESCGRPDCGYCGENHDPEKQLSGFFGYSAFREKPAAPGGQSLQRKIVTACLADRPVMGILPTGGGKSLCYQLPALVRYRRCGALTVVISPLQALMKDQVDNLVRKTGTLFAEAIYGMQTLPERAEVFERIRLGDTAILYISPEQLRSMAVRNVLRQREIGCWVFDEAHCLSKWGHDFRPDYLYAARFIREFAMAQRQPVPPICCFTATAKKSVVEEIIGHFREELDQRLDLFEGGVERENLFFAVIPVKEAEKLQKTHEIVSEQLAALDAPAGIIVYAATRAVTEEISGFLQRQGISAKAFHAGIEAGEKREIIETFVSGELPVICATNAFGMGIDKENIRLVLHYEMPGSLENYLQEAGRAGRDLKPARCVLLYDSQDAGRQFQLGALSELRQKDIARILRALRRKKRNRDGDIVVTNDELLRDEELADMRSLQPDLRDTRVRTAVAWLERSGFLRRNQNLTEVFQGKPRVDSLEEADGILERLHLNRHTRSLWRGLLQHILNAGEDQGMRADDLAGALFPQKEVLIQMERRTGLTAAQIVITALHDMADAGLLDQGVMLSAIFRPRGKYNAGVVFRSACDLENRMISLLQEEDPDADDGSWVELSIRRLKQKLANEGIETSPEVLRQLVKGISYDGKGYAASRGSFEIRHVDRHRYQVRLHRSWENIRRTIFLRQNVAHVILKTLSAMAAARAIREGAPLTGEVQLSFTSDQLSAALRGDITLRAQVKKILPVIDRALMFLHEQKVIILQGGLAVLRRAMTIRLTRRSRGRTYSKSDFKPLAVHYRERRLQVHVMVRYASLGLEKIAAALTLVLDYFSLGRVRFINKYFKDDRELLEKAATAESYRRIVEGLRNPVQIAAVGAPLEENLLILAGPGSGKTTVILHRCAYLLEVERIPARQILVLCFNHSSAVQLRKRLNDLAGRAARGVMVATYHGAAMRLAGISVRDMGLREDGRGIDFDGIITDAVELLKGQKDIPGLAPDEVRDSLLAGFSHILVDEYQDIDERQYELVSAIAGRSLEEDGRLTILAVGDDDQNIYTFRGANVRFIRRFRRDYRARVVYLVENYRSSRHIIAVANTLIGANRDRMKGDHPIRINREREATPAGGRWGRLDPVGQGRVRIVTVEDAARQAACVKSEIERLAALDPEAEWRDFAVLSRTREALSAVRAVLEEAGYPIKITLDRGLLLHRVREVCATLEWLTRKEGGNVRAGDLQRELAVFRGPQAAGVWWELVDGFLETYREETGDSLLPVGRVIDRLYEFFAEQHREKTVGHGIFLGTVHGIKGMEFPHVFILDGDWRTPADSARREEERRILYVGMTRARETLQLMRVAGRPNPFLKEIRGGCVMPLTWRGVAADGQVERTYELLGLDEIYLDYAGTFPADHAIHRHLAALGTGQRVALRPEGSRVVIADPSGHCIGRLSAEGAERWRRRLERILEVRVVAVLQRFRDDPDERFTGRIRADRWELPVLEAVWRRR